jgi:hypothetical protein
VAVAGILCLGLPETARAVEGGGAGWVGVTLRAPFAERYAFLLEIEPRFFERPERAQVVLLRPWFEVALAHGLSVALGYDALVALSPEARQEHRLWQQLAHRHAFDSVATVAQLRLEQRFFSEVASVSIRARLRGGIEVPIVREVGFVLDDELFLSFNEIPSFDPAGPSENRLIVGFSWGPREWARALLGYQNQWLRQLDLINHTLLLRLAFELPTS